MARRFNGRWGGFPDYVPVARRRQLAAREARRASEHGQPLDPVRIEGRTIARTPWGCAWCRHIERFRDYENRLPRGRTYVRNGSVYHLAIAPGEIRARVMGSRAYEQRVEIARCAPAVWQGLRARCAGGIGSLIELLEGRLSSAVMAAMTADRDGLMPDLRQVKLSCSCPDWASLCKHLAAVLYGVGARLDERPELLFTLRGVDPAELVDVTALPGRTARPGGGARRVEGDLSSVFGIELDDDVEVPGPAPSPAKPERVTRKSTATKSRSKAPASASSRRGRKVHRQALLAAGVPPGTISTWLRNGVLEPSGERGVYRHTRESRSHLKRYGP